MRRVHCQWKDEEETDHVPLYSLRSFYEVLYSTPSRLLLRSAPDPSTAEKDSFEASIDRFRVDSGMQAQRQREPVPEGGANH